MNAAGGRNTIFMAAKCLADDFDKTFDLEVECLLAPTFPIDEIENQREQSLTVLSSMTDTPQGEAAMYFNRVFFADSPYRFPMPGTPAAIKALTRDKLVAWHKQYVAANNLVVAVFGGIDMEKAEQRVTAALGSLAANKDLAFPKNAVPRAVPAREVYIKPTEKKGAAVVYVAYPGTDIYNVRDRFALMAMDRILTGYDMPSGGLHEELRGKGLVYEVQAFSMEGLRPGYTAAMAICQPEKVAEVVKLIEEAMGRAARDKFGDEDLAAARASLITSHQLSRETIDGAAYEAAVDEALGLGFDFAREEVSRIRQVGADDILRVARQYLKKPVIVVLTSDPAAAEAIRK
jgi:zinc protease